MPYAGSLNALIRLEPQLASLKTGKPVRWTQLDGRASAYAGKVRAALAVAARNPKLYPELARAAALYKIVVLDVNTVFANPAEEQTATLAE